MLPRAVAHEARNARTPEGSLPLRVTPLIDATRRRVVPCPKRRRAGASLRTAPMARRGHHCRAATATVAAAAVKVNGVRGKLRAAVRHGYGGGGGRGDDVPPRGINASPKPTAWARSNESGAPPGAPVVCDEGFVLGACTLLRAAPETHGRGAGCQVPGCVR